MILEKRELPICSFCPNKNLTVDLNKVYRDNELAEEVATVSCVYASICSEAMDRTEVYQAKQAQTFLDSFGFSAPKDGKAAMQEEGEEKTAPKQATVPPMPEVKPPKRTNFDRLKEMTIVDFCKWFISKGADACPPSEPGEQCRKMPHSCIQCWMEWMEREEVTEDVY